jgi:acyl phosphate:glycerol-3-phosphate acyltransferase
MTILAAILGYAIGSLPTANGIAGLRGIDLRSGGSGNPGANNARRLGGPALALAVLVVEMAKGALAVVLGMALAGDAGAVAAGIGAAAGNVYNVWYGFEGGKGLGITLGVLIAAWPMFAPIALLVLGISSAITRSTGVGTLVTLVSIFVASLLWADIGIEAPWGVTDPELFVVLGIGLPLILWRPHWKDARARLRRPAPL